MIVKITVGFYALTLAGEAISLLSTVLSKCSASSKAEELCIGSLHFVG